jgi:hypothetical protein
MRSLNQSEIHKRHFCKDDVFKKIEKLQFMFAKLIVDMFQIRNWSIFLAHLPFDSQICYENFETCGQYINCVIINIPLIRTQDWIKGQLVGMCDL